MAPTVTRVLVTAATRHGSTAEIAGRIAADLRERGIVVDDLPPADVQDLTSYDGVVIGSAIYEGRWLRAARSLVARNAAQLGHTRVWLFSSGPVGKPLQPSDGPDVVAVMARSSALDHRIFPGRLDVARLSPLERLMVRAVPTAEGDFRDWPAIDDWATGIAETLLQAPGMDRYAGTG